VRFGFDFNTRDKYRAIEFDAIRGITISGIRGSNDRKYHGEVPRFAGIARRQTYCASYSPMPADVKLAGRIIAICRKEFLRGQSDAKKRIAG
jgi:hypothetical protein